MFARKVESSELDSMIVWNATKKRIANHDAHVCQCRMHIQHQLYVHNILGNVLYKCKNMWTHGYYGALIWMYSVLL